MDEVRDWGLVACVFNPSTQEVDAGGLGINSMSSSTT